MCQAEGNTRPVRGFAAWEPLDRYSSLNPELRYLAEGGAVFRMRVALRERSSISANDQLARRESSPAMASPTT